MLALHVFVPMRSVIFTAHNHVTLLHCGAEFFPALVAAIDAAKVQIYLETYIFAADETGNEVKEALIRAVTRGVIVNVIVDWVGTGRTQTKLLKQQFHEAGVHCRSFNPWFRRGVVRTHRKICVVDREIAFLGGLNINYDMRADDNSGLILPAPRWDFAVSITGPLVADIHLAAEAQWARLGPLNLKLRWELFKEERATKHLPLDSPTQAALVMRDNLRNRRTIQRVYLKALGNARERVLLTNPYFAPDRKLCDALTSAAARGVNVKLLLGVGQFRILDAVAQSFYPKLLKAGVKIFEYRKTQLHGKVAVIDNDWATVGSSNYDGFSLFVNHEANIVIKDAGFANKLRAHIEHGITESVAIKLEDYANVPWYKRAWYGGASWFYRSVLSIITSGKYTK